LAACPRTAGRQASPFDADVARFEQVDAAGADRITRWRD